MITTRGHVLLPAVALAFYYFLPNLLTRFLLAFVLLHYVIVLGARVVCFFRYRSLPQLPETAPLKLKRAREKLGWALARMPRAPELEQIRVAQPRILLISFVLTPAVFGVTAELPPIWTYACFGASLILFYVSQHLPGVKDVWL